MEHNYRHTHSIASIHVFEKSNFRQKQLKNNSYYAKGYRHWNRVNVEQ